MNLKKYLKNYPMNIRTAPAIMLVAGSLLFCASLTEKGYASSAQPGSSADPLVSQSYVDGKFNQLQTQISSIITSMGNTSTTPGQTTGGGQTTSGSRITNDEKDMIVDEVIAKLEFLYGRSESVKFEPVFANDGDILMLGEGTEIILRSGNAIGYITAANGLSNVSNGTEIFNNGIIPSNNLIISSRNDGRGVMAMSDAWFLIKGDYNFMK